MTKTNAKLKTKPQNKIKNDVVKTKGTADEVDKYVGSRVRMQRTILGLSQEKLADFVGVTFQQVQKYERGANRISASRLLSFSKILQVPVSYFFEGMEETSNLKKIGFAEDAQETFDGDDNNILSKKETLDLLKAYYSEKDAKKRKEIVKFVKSMSKK